MIKKWYHLLLLLLILLSITIFAIFFWKKRISPTATIKVAILHSLSGHLAISERPVADATLLAIKELNQNGGILGKQIEPILVDGKSDDAVFGQEAERLITQDQVAVIFGCWTSPSRRAVKNVVEKLNSLLFYPVQYEGLEDSPHICYASTTPNQQIIPGVTWCLQHLGNRFFLVGTDPLLHEIIKDVVYAHNGTILGEEYLALGDTNVDHIIEKIIDTKPDVILNNIEGDPNLAFYNALRKKGITPEKIPSMSFSVSEPELQAFNMETMTGDYATWSYFQSIESEENKNFVKKIKDEYGAEHHIGDAMEAAYYSVYLWSQAVNKVQSIKTELVMEGLHNQAFNAPQGLIHIDGNSLQSWQYARVGKIRSDKQFTILWSSHKAIAPLPYPMTRTQEEWDALRDASLANERIIQ
jgi:urea transport system substrate-binding protein